MEHHGVVFCKDCPDPHLQGSWMQGWEAEYGPKGYHVTAEAVYAVPNDASADILNPVRGAIAIVDRGHVPLVDKVFRVQEAGAVACLVIDNGGCDYDFNCGRLGSKSEGGLAKRDTKFPWENIFIPVVLVHEEDGRRLREQLDFTTLEIDEHGQQVYVT